MAAVTESVVEFISDAIEIDLPAGVDEIVAVGFCDTIGVTLAALDEPVCQVASEAVRRQGGQAQSRINLGADRTTSEYAALIGAATAHALDYDDYAFSNHVSAVMVPAILAEAELTGASGADMVRAYVTGYEVWRDIMHREPDDIYARGWHPTAVFGAFGVVAAASVLNKLGKDEIRNAIGLAVANSGGVMANFGTMGKPYQGGRAAQAGLTSVHLAMAGMDAGPDALDAENGLLLGLSPERRADVTTPADLGRDWGIMKERLNIKRYPTVGASQRIADCACELHHHPALNLSQIVKIRPYVSEKHIRVMPIHRPQTGLEAKFSIELVAVAGMLNGAVGFHELSDDFVGRADVQELIRKVEPDIGPDDDPVYAAGTRADILHVDLIDGRTISSNEVARWRGHAENPMSLDELKAKFMDCATQTLNEAQAEQYFQVFSAIGELSSTDDIPILMR